jgi:hypothetical protein
VWYVRFGGEEFGPFEKSELDEFIGQLGTADSVEVRKADDREWSAVESNREGGGLVDVETQDDDKTLMSSDMSPELLAEFRALLDEGSEPQLTEGAMPRFSPPNTRADGLPDGVIGHKPSEPSVEEVSLDELLTQSDDRSPRMQAPPPSSPIDSLSKPGMLLPSPKHGPSIPSRQNTTVSQTPDMMPRESTEPKRNPRVTATPPALPSNSATKPKPAVPPQPPQGGSIQPKPVPSADPTPKSSSTLLPSRPPKKVDAKVAKTPSPEPVKYERSKPELQVKPQAAPFQVKRSKKVRTVTIAILVTTLIGGIGAYGIWSKKQESKASQTASVPKRVKRTSTTPSQPKPRNIPAGNPTATDTPGMMDFEAAKGKPAQTPREDDSTVTSPEATAKPAAVKTKAVEAKPVAAPPKMPIEKAPQKTVVKKKAVRQPSKKKSNKAPAKKPLSKRWVRKKSTPVLARLNRAAIETVMKGQRSKLKNCKGPKGIKVTVSLEILSSGVVRKSQIFDRRLDEVSKQCISATLRRAVFPRTKTPVAQIRVPVNL